MGLRKFGIQKPQNFGALNRVNKVDLTFRLIKILETQLHSTQNSSLQELGSRRPSFGIDSETHFDKQPQILRIGRGDLRILSGNNVAIKRGEVVGFKRGS